MPTFRTEIQELIDSVTVAREGESPVARFERILSESFDVVGKSLKAIDEENRDADMAALQEELEGAALVIVGRVFAGRPVIARGVKAGIPFVIDAALQYVAANAGTVLQFSQNVVVPAFARVRRIAEQGEAAFMVQT